MTDDGGQSTVIQSTVIVTAPWTAFPDSGAGGGTGTGSGGPTGAGTGLRSDDPGQSFMLPIGEATVDLNQGGLRLSQPLDFDQSPGTAVGGSPSLVYNSATVGVFPVIQVGLEVDPAATLPSQIWVTLTFNGTAQSPVSFPISGPPGPDGAYHFSVRSTSSVGTTGVYSWSAVLTDGGTNTATTSGTAYVVAQDASPYGAGWWVAGLDQLVVGSAGVLWVTGSGDTRYFTGTGPSYTSPAEDFGSLVKNGDNTFTYTAKDQTKINFDATGRLSSVVDTHGLALSYHYDGSGRLSQVNAPDGGLTALAYNVSSGLLSTITEPGYLRSVQTAMDGSHNLYQITDADGFVRTLGYDALHHATSDGWAPLTAAFGYDPASGLLTKVDRGLGTAYTIVSAAGDDLAAAGAGPRWASVTDGLNHTTHYLLDGRGRLLEQIEADGAATTTYLRDGHGQVVEQTDPLGDPTDYTYNYAAGDGDLVQVAYADGSATSYQYDPTFHHVTVTSTNAGEATTNTYDPTTGDLLTSTDALGNTTTYAWSAGLLQSVTDAAGKVTARYLYDAYRRQILAFDALGDPTAYTVYDQNGNPAATYDAIGAPTFTTYDADNRLVGTTDVYGGTTGQVYDAYGLVTSTTDARGFTASTTYDQRGLAVYQYDYFGGLVEVDTYDAAGNRVAVRDGRAFTTTYSYDADNRVVAVQDAAGDPPDTTAYDLAGNVAATTVGMVRTTTYAYDRLNRRVATTDPMSRTTTTGYDLAGNAVLTTDGRGLPTRTFYDPDNRPAQVLDAKGLSTFTLYDRVGNVSETIDGAGKDTFFFYDADNRQSATLDADGFTTATFYDLVGNVARTVDQRNKTTGYGYDALGRRASTADPDGHVTRSVYDAAGDVVQALDANGRATTYSYDADNRVTAAQDADGFVTQTQYDGDGDVVATIDANGQYTSFFYDQLDRKLASWDPNGHATLTTYDWAGEVASTSDGAGDPTSYGYDADGEQAAVLDGNHKFLEQQQYNDDGQLVSVTDADNNTTKYGYDGDGNQVVTIDPRNGVTSQVFDSDGRVIQAIDRLNRKKVFAYDPAGRLLTETWYNADASLADTLRYTYDNAGNVLSASNNFGGYVYTYDDAGWLHTQTDPFGKVLTYGYDGDGRVTSVADSLGGALASVYDPDGRLTSRQLGGSVAAQARIDYSYTPRGQVAAQSRYTDTAGLNKVGQTVFGYDRGGNVTQIAHQNAAGTTNLLVFASGYDNADRLVSETDTGVATVSYSYDKDSQVTAAGATGYSYDPNGNRTAAGGATYTTGPDNLLTSDGTWTYSYDAENNLIKKSKGSSAETWTYGYTLNDQMAWAEDRATDGGTVLFHENFAYDVCGQLVQTAVTVGGSAVTNYDWDRGQLWAALDGNAANALEARYVVGDNANEWLARVGSSGYANPGLAFYLTDRLGSIRGLTDNTGALRDQTNYDAFGNTVYEANPGFGDAHGYAGYTYIQTVGLYNVDARYYNSATATWTTEDPIGFSAGDPNLHRYAGNDPTNATDPSGLFSDLGPISDLGLFFKSDTWGKIFSTDTLWFLIGLEPGGKGKINGGVYETFAKDRWDDAKITVSLISPAGRVGLGVGGGYDVLAQGARNVTDLRQGRPMRGYDFRETYDVAGWGGLLGFPLSKFPRAGYGLALFGIGDGSNKIYNGEYEEGGLEVGAGLAGGYFLRRHLARRPPVTINAPVTGARNPLALPEGYIGPERQLPYRGPILGGSYRDVRAANVGGDIHHMPADSVSPLSRELGPAIHMPTPEHAQTASFGGSRAARAYRQQQQQLIQQGRFMDAVQMDINDLRNLFGNRYDEHIRQMLEWIRQSRTVPGQ